MEKDFWIQKWESKQIGFHKDFVHPLLKKYTPRLDLNSGDTVLVPLCGKSLDMIWLESQGYDVIGIELSELAIQQFLSENQRDYVVEGIERFKIYKSGAISLYVGDFFDLNSAHFNSVKAVYDRAALIALPEDMAGRYTHHLLNHLPQNSKVLLISLEMDRPGGPPFSQSEPRIAKLYSEFSTCELQRSKDILPREEKFQEEGCTFLLEKVHLITK